ncbi:MAG: lasso RiPP family leader peptide-containing protein [Clostridia bacterium]|nr:lasso RiPP family leader peptide-containing protein [Clostridia bacterium]
MKREYEKPELVEYADLNSLTAQWFSVRNGES